MPNKTLESQDNDAGKSRAMVDTKTTKSPPQRSVCF